MHATFQIYRHEDGYLTLARTVTGCDSTTKDARSAREEICMHPEDVAKLAAYFRALEQEKQDADPAYQAWMAKYEASMPATDDEWSARLMEGAAS